MEEVTNVFNQTPIEFALGIDENGMTIARKLYEFLEMDKAYYARWFNTYIADNQFAEENVDYFPFTTNGECGGRASNNTKLTAKFAKKLSMMQKNEKGEAARNYFVGVENAAKKLVGRKAEICMILNPPHWVKLLLTQRKWTREWISRVQNHGKFVKHSRSRQSSLELDCQMIL